MDKTPSLYINFPNFNKLFEKLKQFCKENNIDTKKYVLQVHMYYLFMEYETVLIWIYLLIRNM